MGLFASRAQQSGASQTLQDAKHRRGRKRRAVRRDHFAARTEKVEIEGDAMEANGDIMPRMPEEWSVNKWSLYTDTVVPLNGASDSSVT